VEAAGAGGFDEVERDLNGGGSGASGTHGRQGLSDGQGHLAGAGDAVDLGEDGPQGGRLVADFVEESVAAARMGQRHSGTDEEHGYRIGEGLEQGGECVEHGGARGRDDDVDLAGAPGRTVGHIAGALFVTWGDDVDSVCAQLGEDLEIVGAGDAEDSRDAFGFERSGQMGAAGEFDHGSSLA
jgi:hypothetical protein